MRADAFWRYITPSFPPKKKKKKKTNE